MKKEFAYRYVGTVTKAQGALGFAVRKRQVTADILMRGLAEDFAAPVGKTFLVKGKLLKVPSVIKKILDAQHAPTESQFYPFTMSALDCTVPLETADVTAKAVVKFSEDMKMIDPLNMTGSPKSGIWSVLVNSAEIEGSAAKTSEKDVEDPPEPPTPPTPNTDGEPVPDDQDGTEREHCPCDVHSIAWPNGKAFSFTTDNEITFKLNIKSVPGGEYPRVLFHKAHDILDVFVGKGGLCWKLHDGNIHFGVPIVGDRTNAQPPDHYGIVKLPGSVIGEHTIQVVLKKSDETITFLWDGIVVGKWPMVRKTSNTPPVDTVIIDHRRYRAGVVPPNPPFGKTWGIMWTDVGCCKNLEATHAANAAKLVQVYNTVYVVGDLRVGMPNDRPHVDFGRTPTTITPLLEANLRRLKSWGFRVILALGNEPSVRNGQSQWLGAHGGQKISVNDIYTDAKLENEKDVWEDALAKLGMEFFDGIVLYLEPASALAVCPEGIEAPGFFEAKDRFTKRLAAHLRAVGYKGRLISTGIGKGAWATPPDVYGAPSIGHVNRWGDGNPDYRSGDGMQGLDANNAPSKLPWMRQTANKEGGWVWLPQFIGTGGPSKLEDWMWKPLLQ